MQEFVTWEMLADFVKLTGIVLTTVQFIKNLPGIRRIPTQYVSWIVSFLLIVVTHVSVKDFVALDIVLYALSAMFVAAAASGVYDAGKAGLEKVKDIIEEKTEDEDIIEEETEDEEAKG